MRAMVCACMHALRADAQRIELSAPHVAHDEKAQHLLEVVGARIDLVVLHGAERARARPPACGAAGRIDAAGVDRDGDDRPAVRSLIHGTRNDVSRPPE